MTSRLAPHSRTIAVKAGHSPLIRVYALALALVGATALPSSAADPSDALVYHARDGDTLIGLGQRLLKRPGDWIKVQRLNRIENPRRIPIGATILIPAGLLRLTPVPVRIVSAQGQAHGDQGVAKAGTSLGEGSVLATSADGYVTIELADGSTLTLQPRSRLRVLRSARLPGSNALNSRIELLDGRIEVRAAKQSGGMGQQILHTPATTLSVRGTRYRAAVADAGTSRAEVTEGRVAAAAPRTRGVVLAAGEGLVAQPGSTRLAPQPLLPAPELGSVPRVHQRLILRLPFAAVPGARAYRAAVATDPSFQQVLVERVAATESLALPAPEDGHYWLRLRAIDAQQLEGLDAVMAIEVRARPEPPFLALPAAGATLRGDGLEMGWAGPLGASHFRLQLAADANFQPLLRDDVALAGNELHVGPLAPGSYHWRMASITEAGRQGPWGDPQTFTLRPAPADPPAPSVSDGIWHFSWPAEAGQRFEFELARDADFGDIIRREALGEPSIELAEPPPGVYFMRVRATDPDGLIGPYTAPRRIEVPARWPWWLMLLMLPVL